LDQTRRVRRLKVGRIEWNGQRVRHKPTEVAEALYLVRRGTRVGVGSLDVAGGGVSSGPTTTGTHQ
jgi:hypothetical protein